MVGWNSGVYVRALGCERCLTARLLVRRWGCTGLGVRCVDSRGKGGFGYDQGLLVCALAEQSTHLISTG